MAVFSANLGWNLEKRTSCASDDATFASAADRVRGQALVAHVRKRTVGEVSVANTHPFHRDGWVFAHNGTAQNVDSLRAVSSPARLDEVGGDTDSEVLFACLLTRLDALRMTNEPATERTDEAIRAFVHEARTRGGFGSFNFILTNGETLYANRAGRSLYVLERTGEGAALLVASESLTGESWEEVAEGVLLRFDRRPHLRVRELIGSRDHGPARKRAAVFDIPYEEELPFTD